MMDDIKILAILITGLFTLYGYLIKSILDRKMELIKKDIAIYVSRENSKFDMTHKKRIQLVYLLHDLFIALENDVKKAITTWQGPEFITSFEKVDKAKLTINKVNTLILKSEIFLSKEIFDLLIDFVEFSRECIRECQHIKEQYGEEKNNREYYWEKEIKGENAWVKWQNLENNFNDNYYKKKNLIVSYFRNVYGSNNSI